MNKIDNEIWEPNGVILPSSKCPLGGNNARTIGGANPEYMKIKKDTCIYIPIFI